MSISHTSSQATGAWLHFITLLWQRWQRRVSRLYQQRVTLPVQFWLACGRPAEYRPRLPWWQPFVYRYLVATGWAPKRKRSRRRRF